jgi:hypothetical protein
MMSPDLYFQDVRKNKERSPLSQRRAAGTRTLDLRVIVCWSGDFAYSKERLPSGCILYLLQRRGGGT